MKKFCNKIKDRVTTQESGYVMVIVLILLAVAAISVASSLNLTTTSARSTGAVKTRSKNFFNSEESLQRSVNWLRSNSTSLALMFSRTNFYTSFDRTAPAPGENEDVYFEVPSKLRIQATSDAPILSQNSELADSQFPATTDSVTGAAFNPVSSYSAAALGTDKVRITLVDAVPVDPTKDFGDTDTGNPTPQTDFNPIYRVDAMTDEGSGAHLFAYVFGSLVYDYGFGFYGKNFIEIRQNCDSYVANNGAYSSASKQANCTVGSDSIVRIHGTTKVYGTARTNGSILTSSPWGGKVCADFVNGCPNAGQTCEGATCNVSGLPTYSPWSTYCPSNQGDLAINANSTLLVAGNSANQKCWNQITIANNKTLTLKTTNYSYFIDTLSIPNNGVLNFAPNPSTGTINLYVRKFVGNNFNGNQVLNINNKPYQLRIHYLGDSSNSGASLLLNGTAAMSAFLIAPYASVSVQGNFTYNGGIKALDLTMTGSGNIHYDESGGITTISDVAYKMRNVEERYR